MPGEIRLNLVVLDKKNKLVLDLKSGEIAITDGDSPVNLSNLRLVNGKEKSEHLLTLLFDQPGLVEDGHGAVDPSAMSQSRDTATKILKIFPESSFTFSVLDVQRRLQLQHSFTSDRKALDLAITAATQPDRRSCSERTGEGTRIRCADRSRFIRDRCGFEGSGA